MRTRHPGRQWEQLEQLVEEQPEQDEPALGVKPRSLLWANTDMRFFTSADPHFGHWTAAFRSKTSSSNSSVQEPQEYS